jgi:hypothetical protein
MSQGEMVQPGAVPVVLVPQRHPLALPEGSVRVSLVLLILLPFWLLLSLPEHLVSMPLFLYPLLGLVVIFFHGHDHTVRPWHLPWWFFPLVIIGVTGGLIGWRFYTDGDLSRITPYGKLDALPYLVVGLGGGYTAGWIMAHVGNWAQNPKFQDLRASISLLAMLLLSVAIIIHLFINSTLTQLVDSPVLETIVTILIAWYFGSRS